MASLNFQLPNIPIEQLRRDACLAAALKWAEPDIYDLETSTREIVKAAAAFEAFVSGTLGVIDEQPPEPKQADAPKAIRAWVARDKHWREAFQTTDVFVHHPPAKEVHAEAEVFVANEGGQRIATNVDPDFLGISIAPGEVVEVEITIRKV